jgi:pimeloyl-ACP methyl ester carboxylesterase
MGYGMEGFDRFVGTMGGVECVRYEIGSGPPLVYFHGGGTYHGFDWARDFAGHFRVILPIHPNFGESGDADFRSVEAYADHHSRLLATLGLTRFSLAGASMGGLFAATYAAQHPEQVEALALVSPAGLGHPAAMVPDFPNIPRADMPGLLVADPSFLEPFWPAAPSPDWIAMRMREALASLKARGDDAATERRLRDRLPAVTMPVLLLWGEQDRIMQLPLLGEWQAALPHARSLVIRGGGHLLLDEFPQARQAALDFLLRERRAS